MLAQVVEGELVGGWMSNDDRATDPEVAIDVEQLSRVQQAPSRALVHTFAGHHDRRGGGERTGADADSAGGAGLVEVAVFVGTACGAVQYQQLVGVRIAQCEQLPEAPG
ncbi:MAG: hypothetical protein ACRDS0_13135 [Pseudonocardiaceae bacterium]